MSMQQITEAATAMVALKEAIDGKIDAIDAAVAAKSQQVDDFLLNAREKLGAPIEIGYDRTVIHSKTSLNLAADPANNTRTVWSAMADINGGSYAFGVNEATHFAFLSLPRAFGPEPGFYEEPKYSNDTSVTGMDFVVAAIGSTSAQINEAIATSGLVAGQAGAWSLASATIKLPILTTIVAEPSFTLFVRFRNRGLTGLPGANPNPPPLPVLNFGGNTSFSLSALNIFRK